MAIQLKYKAGNEIYLCYKTAKEWLETKKLIMPIGFNEEYVKIFIEKREKTYSSENGGNDFLQDLKGFYFGYEGIAMAKENIKGYNKHILQQTKKWEEHKKNDFGRAEIEAILSIEKGKPLRNNLNEYVAGLIDKVFKEERLYTEECIESLDRQEKWHTEGQVDKWKAQEDDMVKRLSNDEFQCTKPKVKNDYWLPIRNKLSHLGFVLSPPDASLGAVFPKEDWENQENEDEFRKNVDKKTDDLSRKYQLIGDDKTALTRLLMVPKSPPQSWKPKKMKDKTYEKRWKNIVKLYKSSIGCLCISWTRHKNRNGATTYIPVLGISGVIKDKQDDCYFRKFCRHLGLPSPLICAASKKRKVSYKISEQARLEIDKKEGEKINIRNRIIKNMAKDKKQSLVNDIKRLTREAKKIKDEDRGLYDNREAKLELIDELYVNYETMILRANEAAVGYRIRNHYELRKPARQALLSYVSFRKEKKSPKLDTKTLQDPKHGVDLWFCGWHSLNCAEPAALMTASSYFGEGSDVLICYPYEGKNQAGKFRNRPKETCPWCAAVELGFRSLSKSQNPDNCVNTGVWQTQQTNTMKEEPNEVLSTKIEFDANDNQNQILTSTRNTLSGKTEKLVINKDLNTDAYHDNIQTKIGRIRSMYHLLGLIDPEVIALDRQLFRWR